MSELPEAAGTAARLLAAIRPFDTLPEAARLALAAQARERRVVPGEMVVREGEYGDEFFLVAAGALHVLGRGFDGSDLVLARLEEGTCFGEQALLSLAPVARSASVRAATRCRLLVLPRAALVEAGQTDPALLAIMRRRGERQKAERGTLFRDRILQDLGIGGSYAIERFPAGAHVFREGERGDKIYLVLAGRARVVRGTGDGAKILAELLPGQFFGERAILNDAPRNASVLAAEPLEAAVLDGAWFRAALADNPRLRSVMASLQAMYILPERGLVTLQGSGLASHPSLTAVHHLADGRRVVSIRLVEADAFRAQLVGAPEANSSVQFFAAETGTRRRLHLFDGRIVEIESEGAWPGLGAAFARLLDGGVVSEAEILAFSKGGNLDDAEIPQRHAAEIICRCAGVTAGSIVAAVASGCDSVERIATETRATMVCGGCMPAVKEFLGEGEWAPASCVAQETLAPDVRLFRLRTSRGRGPRGLPGQHLVLQARIRGRWVERPYTVASAPRDDGICDIVVRREREGLLSRWLFNELDAASALRISPLRGTFCVGPGHSRDIVFFAGGIGVTPALALARGMPDLPGRWILSIHHSVSTEAQAVCRDELEALMVAQPRLAFRLRVTGREGRIGAAEIKAAVDRHPDAEFRICGSAAYVAGVTALLEGGGVAADRFRVERFTPVG